MTPREHADKVLKVLDSEATNLRGEEYREFLDEIYADVESKLTCLDEEEAEED